MIAKVHPLFVGAEVISIASNTIIKSITALYGATKSINDFINDHIEEMKEADNHTVSRTGRVLEEAKLGFGIGFITPVVVIATGQLILGNPLSAVAVVATSPINPIAMTCAAVGAIYYGWNVLTDQEKNEILEKLSKGLEIGIQLIKSVIGFIIDKTKELWVSENLNEIKKYISSAAAIFGNTLGDITKKVIDKVVDSLDIIKKKTGETIDKTGDVLSDACDAMKEQGGKAADLASGAYDSVREQGEKAVERIKSRKSNSVTEINQDSLEDNKNRLE